MKLPPEQQISRTQKLVSAARSVLSGQVGMTVGVQTLSNKLDLLGNDWEYRYRLFNKYLSTLPLDIPVGTERLHWNHEKLLKTDRKLAKFEFKWRAKIMAKCAEIIKNHSEQTHETDAQDAEIN